MTQDLDFASLGLNADILENLANIGFTKPTPIQANSIPELLGGDRDILGLAQTGAGKPWFSLPIIEKIDPKQRQVQALILAPTRELAKQIAEEFGRLRGPKRRIDSVTIYGGSSYETQVSYRQGAQVVVNTRSCDRLASEKLLRLDNLRSCP